MRTIYIVNASQVVVSENHPEGLYSNKTGYPKTFDSAAEPYNGDTEKCFKFAEAGYRKCEAAMLEETNPNRVMTTITMERHDGKSIYHRSIGAFPVIAPPEPEPEPEPEETV